MKRPAQKFKVTHIKMPEGITITTQPGFDFARSADGGAVSPLSQALNAYKGALLHTKHDLPHPISMHSRATRELDRAVAALITAASRESTRSGLDAAAGADFDLVHLWQDTVYRATELFDTYCQHLPTALGAKDDKAVRRRLDPFIDAAKKRRSPWALLCNRLKHNHHVLTPHRSRFESGKTVDSYRVSKHDQDHTLRAATEFHRHANAISFGVGVRELLHDVLRTDQTAAKMVGQSEGSGGSIFASSLPILPSLERWPNPYERGSRSTVESTHGGYWLTKLALSPIPESARMSTMFTGDGITRSFDLP
ncbi:hypothetical protein D3C85_736540 [compost metagenome]